LEHAGTSEKLAVIGTTHVDRSSVERVRRIISQTRPSVVAVELDEERLWALRNPERDKLGSPLRSGLLPWMLALLERSVGSLTNVLPGSEMLEAVEGAQAVGARVVLIDKPIGAIMTEFQGMPLREKFRIVLDILLAFFAIGARRRAARVEDLTLEKLMAEFDAKYPTLSRILVKERDRYMAERLQDALRSTDGRVVAVVGLGHVKGITEHLAAWRKTSDEQLTETRYEWTVRTLPG